MRPRSRDVKSSVSSRSGRPRNAALDDRFLDAALDLVAERGYDGVTLEEVARRAGSSRPSIYRRWPDRDHLLLDAVRLVFRRMDAALPRFRRGMSVSERIARFLEAVIRGLQDWRLRRIMAAMVAALHQHPELADLQRLIQTRRGIVLRRLLERAIERGELAREFDIEVALDLIMGPVFYRCLVLDLPLEPEDAARITRQALLVATPGDAPSKSDPSSA